MRSLGRIDIVRQSVPSGAMIEAGSHHGSSRPFR